MTLNQTIHSAEPSNKVWKALADPKRRQMLEAMSERPQLTGELVERFPSIGRTGVLKHIGILEDADLIIVKREGRKRWNYLNPGPVLNVCNSWIARHIEGVTASIADLQQLAETEYATTRKGK